MLLMKKCPRCGMLHPDEDRVCVVDGQPLCHVWSLRFRRYQIALCILLFGIGLGVFGIWYPIHQARAHEAQTILIAPQIVIVCPLIAFSAVMILFGVRPGRSEKIVCGIGLAVGILAVFLLIWLLDQMGYPLRM
jgi:hypothetical protein